MQRIKITHLTEFLRYDMKLFDDETSILELWIGGSTHLLPLLPGPLWFKLIVPIVFLLVSQIELCKHLLCLEPFNYVQIKLLMLDNNTWNYLTEYKQWIAILETI